MACSRCGKKSTEKFTPASTASGEPRPRPALRQRPVKHAARQGRFGQPIAPAQQPSPPAEG